MRLVGKNFKCFGYFDITFEPGTCNAVVGQVEDSDYSNSNGAGKTTLGIHALCWVRYGKYPGMGSADSPVNLKAGKGCEVHHEFKDINGHDCIIQRKRKPNSLQFWQNGTEVTGDMKVVQEAINKAVGCEYDFYVKVFLYTGADEHKFARLTDAKQKEILDTILPMEFDKARELAAEQQRLKFEELNASSIKISQATQAHERIMAKVEEEKVKYQQWEESKDADWEAEEQKLKDWSRVHAERTNLVSVKQAEVDTLAEKYREADRKHTLAAATRRSLEHQLNDERARLASLEGKAGNDVCPMCNQEIAGEAAQTVEARITEVRNAVTTLEQQFNALEPIDQLIIDKDHHKRGLDRYSEELRLAQRDLQEAEHNIETLTMALNNRPTGDNPHMAVMKALEEEAATLHQQCEEMLAQEPAISADIDLWKTVNDALGPKGLKHFAFETLCPQLSATGSTFIEHLSPKGDLQVGFKSFQQKGKKIKEGFFIEASRKDGPQTYSDLSGGEKARIDLVVFLTLFLTATERVSNSGLVVFDEIADTLDSTGKQLVMQLLDFFSDEYGLTCLVLTNDPSITAHVPHGYYRCTRDQVIKVAGA